jgi:hypothetical protein
VYVVADESWQPRISRVASSRGRSRTSTHLPEGETDMATDFLDEKHSEIRARLKELKPLVAEYQRP